MDLYAIKMTSRPRLSSHHLNREDKRMNLILSYQVIHNPVNIGPSPTATLEDVYNSIYPVRTWWDVEVVIHWYIKITMLGCLVRCKQVWDVLSKRCALA